MHVVTIWSRTCLIFGMSSYGIAYNEIYNAIQNGVIQAGENEAAGVEAMKFYEVGPNINLTQHAITIRPICFSGKTFKKLPPEDQSRIRQSYQRYRELPPERRRELRERWKEMTPPEQQDIRRRWQTPPGLGRDPGMRRSPGR